MGFDTALLRHHRATASRKQQERDFLAHLASAGQSPDAVYIGCSDSRVVPELLTDSEPGRLFVVRNVANLVPPLDHADASVGAALDFAVGHLRVPHLVVCGHDGCGGVLAALEKPDLGDLPSLAEWLKGVEPAVARAGVAGSPTERCRRAVQHNVLVQLENLLSFPIIRRAIEADKLQLHGWVYDIETLALRVYDAELGQFVASQDVLGAAER